MAIPGEWERRDERTMVVPVSTDDRRIAAIGADPNGVFPGGREPPAWVEVSFGAVAILGAMLLVMWAQQGSRACVASPEGARQLQLSRMTDREHLAADSASATRTARRYIASDAATAERQQRFTECEALLVRGIAITHGVSMDQVRASGRYAQ